MTREGLDFDCIISQSNEINPSNFFFQAYKQILTVTSISFSMIYREKKNYFHGIFSIFCLYSFKKQRKKELYGICVIDFY